MLDSPVTTASCTADNAEGTAHTIYASRGNPLNVLLVVYAFPPAGGVGTLRAASLARYFPAEGIRLDVLTTRNPSSVVSDLSLLDDIPNSVTIHRTVTIDIPFVIKKRIKSFLAGPTSHSTHATASASTPSLLTRIMQDLLLPDPQVTWLPVLTRAARRIVSRRNIDLVLITGAPFSNYLLAKRLRRLYPRLPIVLEFRDEWLTTSFGVGSFVFSRSERARRFAIRAEADAIASASAVVSVTRAGLREIQSRYPTDPESKYYYIPNGFDSSRLPEASWTQKRSRLGNLVVTYIGTIYNSTAPTTFVTAMHSLPPDVKSRIALRFIGHIEQPRYRESLLSLGEMVELSPHVPQGEALKAIREADYLLLINHGCINVAAKFYDYLGSGKPILACIHPAGEERQMLEELQAGWWAASDDVAGMRQLFLDAAGRGSPPLASFQPDLGKIAQYERKVLAQRYAALLHSIAGKSTEPDLQKQTADVEV